MADPGTPEAAPEGAAEDVVEETPSENVEPADESAEAPKEESAEEPAEEPEAKAERNREGYVTRLNAKLNRQQQQIERMQQEAEARSKPAPKEAPTPESFSDYEQYLAALVDYKAEQRFGEMQSKTEQETQRREAEAAQRQLDERWEDSAQAAREKYDDFDDVALGEVTITDVMSQAIKRAKTGGEIAYWLGKHPKDADRIAALSPDEQIMEIGSIRERLTAAKPPRPPPPKPVSRGRTNQTTSQNTLNDNLSLEDWMKFRNKEAGR